MKMTKYKKYKNFKGNLNDLISIIKESLIDLNLYDASLKYDRLIRYYIQEELLPRPFREGKEFFYDYSHLVRFLYARKQIKDGWPINKLKETTKYEKEEFFEEFLYPNNTSMGLISEFKQKSSPSRSDKVLERKINLISRKDRSSIPNTRAALQNINSEISNVLKQELTSLELSTSLKLLIETKLLSTMDYDFAKKIGEAVTASLVERNPMKVDDFKRILNDYKKYTNQDQLIKKFEKEIKFLEDKFEESKIDFKNEIKNLEEISQKEKAIFNEEISALKYEIVNKGKRYESEIDKLKAEKDYLKYENDKLTEKIKSLKINK